MKTDATLPEIPIQSPREALMLQEGITLEAVASRGLRVDPRLAEVALFEPGYRFAAFAVRDGVTREMLRGPFDPPAQ